ncbi:MAG: ABC transporter ATP-binding protein [Gammaproteobacteria bacterium]|nr:ABC transporter ATP-binding protein [Gammaproteobacteria bacterium]
MITLEKVSKFYETRDIRTTALHAVSLSVDEGSFIAITGASGSGKSTLLNVVGLLDKADGGHYWFKGRDLFSLGGGEIVEFRKRHLGFIFQNFNLIDELSVFENVELPLLYQGIATAERRQRVMAMLERLDVAHRAGHYPLQLSGGQQQRVAIARALVGRPSLLLADEPTGNLDSQHGLEVMRMLQALNMEGSTILMVTHSAEHAACARQVCSMCDGRLKLPDPIHYELAV